MFLCNPAAQPGATAAVGSAPPALRAAPGGPGPWERGIETRAEDPPLHSEHRYRKAGTVAETEPVGREQGSLSSGCPIGMRRQQIRYPAR